MHSSVILRAIFVRFACAPEGTRTRILPNTPRLKFTRTLLGAPRLNEQTNTPKLNEQANTPRSAGARLSQWNRQKCARISIQHNHFSHHGR